MAANSFDHDDNCQTSTKLRFGRQTRLQIAADFSRPVASQKIGDVCEKVLVAATGLLR